MMAQPFLTNSIGKRAMALFPSIAKKITSLYQMTVCFGFVMTHSLALQR